MSSVLFSVYKNTVTASLSGMRFISTRASAIAFSQTGAPQDIVKYVLDDLALVSKKLTLNTVQDHILQLKCPSR